jgi:hypothetical protein
MQAFVCARRRSRIPQPLGSSRSGRSLGFAHGVRNCGSGPPLGGSREVEIRARVGGIIEQRLYEEGSYVEAGLPLFQLDPKSYEAQLAAAEALLARTRALRGQKEREWNRLKPLAEEKSISRKALDDAQSDYELAVADLKAAEAAVREARLQLDYTRVTAPIAGVAGLAEKVEGAVVTAAVDRLTTLTVTDPMDVYFSISENEWLLRQQESLLHRPPDLRAVCSIFIVLAGLAAMRACRSRSTRRSRRRWSRCRHLPRRLGRGAGTDRRRAAGEPDQRRRGMLYMSSTSASNGVVQIQVTFEIGTDVDKAALNVNNRVKQAEPRLPRGSAPPGRDGREGLVVVPAGARLLLARRRSTTCTSATT